MREGHIEFPLGTECMVNAASVIPNPEDDDGQEPLLIRIQITYVTSPEVARAFGAKLGKVVRVDRSDEHEALLERVRRVARIRQAMAATEKDGLGAASVAFVVQQRDLNAAVDELVKE